MSRTLEQIRAAHAYQKVRSLTSKPDEWQEKYSSYAKSLPATILANGLGQATASLLSAAKGQSDDPHMVLYRHLEEWLCRCDDNRAPYPGTPNCTPDLMESITGEDRKKYLHAQAEALEWLSWLKKFAVALLKQPEGGNG